MIPSFSLHRPHPWHGLEPGPDCPRIVTAYIEITPFDTLKYEVDKVSGYLKVDRPQRTSSLPPLLYGFIPRTYCGEGVGRLSAQGRRGDGDPLDICVLSERPVNRPDVILSARVVGGIQMVDKGEADDKIVGVLVDDPLWGHVQDIQELPKALLERLEHYFNTYKLQPGKPSPVVLERRYGFEHARKVVATSRADYDAAVGV